MNGKNFSSAPPSPHLPPHPPHLQSFGCLVNGKNFSYPDPEPLVVRHGEVVSVIWRGCLEVGCTCCSAWPPAPCSATQLQCRDCTLPTSLPTPNNMTELFLSFLICLNISFFPRPTTTLLHTEWQFGGMGGESPLARRSPHVCMLLSRPPATQLSGVPGRSLVPTLDRSFQPPTTVLCSAFPPARRRPPRAPACRALPDHQPDGGSAEAQHHLDRLV